MAVAISAPTTAVASTANVTSYAMGAFTPAALALLVMLVFADGTAAAGSASGGGLTWTLKTSFPYNGSDTCYVFYANTGASPASCTPTFDCTGDAATGCVQIIYQVTGCDISGDPFVQAAHATGTGTAPSVAFGAALKTANAYMAAFGLSASVVGSTQPSGWTLSGQQSHAAPAAGAQGAFRVNGETGSTYGFVSGTGNWGIVGLELRPRGIAGMARGANTMIRGAP